jgi:transposase InsO family protein
MTFDYEVEHIAGKENYVPDALSRRPCSEDNTTPGNRAMDLLFVTKSCEMASEAQLLEMGAVTDKGPRNLIEEICKAQDSDPWIVMMKQFLNVGELPVNRNHRKRIIKQSSLYLLSETSLYKSHTNSEHLLCWQLVVPSTIISKVLFTFHDEITAGHPGIAETLRAVSDRFYWSSMRADVTAYVQSCIVCARCKSRNYQCEDRMRSRNPSRPWETLAVDLMGPYPRSRHGKVNLLVVTDLFTRWVEMIPMGQASASKIISAINEQITSRYGYPKHILADNGPQFRGNMWKRACEMWGAEFWTTPVYHPRANPTERRNQEVKKLIRLTIEDDHRYWDVNIQHIAFNLRDRRNSSTGFSPSELLLGCKLKRPGDWALAIPTNEDNLSTEEWVRHKTEQLEIRSASARESAQALQEKYCDNQFKPGKNYKFKVSELVLIRNHPQSNAQQNFNAGFAKKWVGPYPITEVLSGEVYRIEKQNNKSCKLHSKDLKIWHERRAHNSEMSVIVNVPVEEEEEDDSEGQGPAYNLRPRN